MKRAGKQLTLGLLIWLLNEMAMVAFDLHLKLLNALNDQFTCRSSSLKVALMILEISWNSLQRKFWILTVVVGFTTTSHQAAACTGVRKCSSQNKQLLLRHHQDLAKHHPSSFSAGDGRFCNKLVNLCCDTLHLCWLFIGITIPHPWSGAEESQRMKNRWWNATDNEQTKSIGHLTN